MFQNKLLKKLFSEEDAKLVVPSNVRVKVSAQKPVLSTPRQNKKTVLFSGRKMLIPMSVSIFHK